MDIIGAIVGSFDALVAHVPWTLVYEIARVVFIALDAVALWLMYVYTEKALSYRIKIDLRALPPNIAEILKRAGVREKYASQWDEVKKTANANPPASYRDAIMSADAIVDKLLQEAGFVGRDTAERFGRLNAARMSPAVVNGLFRAHRMRNTIAHDATFVPSARVAEQTLNLYARFLEATKIIT